MSADNGSMGRRAVALSLSLVAGCTGDIGALIVEPPTALPPPPVVTPPPTPPPSVPPDPPPPPPPPPPPFAPGAPVVRRLVGPHYVATISTLLGPEAAALAVPPPDAALNGLDAIGASQLALDAAAVRAYEASSRAVAEAAVAGGILARYAPCRVSGDGSACYRAFIQSFGRVLFRRPLDVEELDAWTALGRDANVRAQDFDLGLRALIAGMLQAPSFLYRVELGAPDPSKPGWSKLTPHELATRMAFFLTERGPDAILLDAADAGELETIAQLRAQAVRLLATPEARGALASYYDEVLRLRELAGVTKNAELFPELDASLRASMRGETQRLIADLAWTTNSDFRQIFSADYTFVDHDLANLYGVRLGVVRGFGKVTLPASTKRGGILGHASLHTILSHATTTSPTHRGKFVREVLMCQTIPPPPPGVVTVIPPDPVNTPRTMRQRLEDIHASVPSCASCHDVMDGIGFGLENFDPIGRYRELDNGLPVNARTELDGVAFEGAAELGRLLAPMRSTMVCTARGLYRQAMGRIEAESEEPSITDIVRGFEASGWKMQELLANIVTSEGFRFVKGE